MQPFWIDGIILSINNNKIISKLRSFTEFIPSKREAYDIIPVPPLMSTDFPTVSYQVLWGFV